MWQDIRLTQRATLLHKHLLKKVREKSHFPIAINNSKYLGTTLTKQVEDLYDKNFKSLKKEIQEDSKK